MRALTNEEIKYFSKQANGVFQPVRFMYNGCSYNITNGNHVAKYTNIIHQYVYWTLSRKAALAIAKLTGTKAVFSE